MKTRANPFCLLLQACIAACPFIFCYNQDPTMVFYGYWKSFDGLAEYYLHISIPLGVEALLLIAALYYAIKYLHSRKCEKRVDISALLLAVLFSLFQVFGNSFDLIASWGLITQDWNSYLFSLVFICGYSILFFYLLRFSFQFILSARAESLHKARTLDKCERAYQFLTHQNCLILVWCIVFFCWLPYLVISYPGTIADDAGTALHQYFGIKPLALNNMVAYTFLIGTFVNLGMHLGNPRAGLFAFTLLQFLFCSGLVACAMWYFARRQVAEHRAWLFVLLCFALLPVFPAYAVYIGKDSLYSALLFAAMLILLFLLAEPESVRTKPFLLWLLGLSLFLACIFRANGIFVVVLSAPVIVFVFRRHWPQIATVLVAVIICNSIYTGLTSNIPNVIQNANVQRSSVLDIMCMQTARYVYVHGDEVTEEERAVIDTILDYDAIPQSYNAEITDPLVMTYREHTAQQRSAYYRIWFQQLLKHPKTYVQAVMNKSYGYFYAGNISREKQFVFYQSGSIESLPVDLSQPHTNALLRPISLFYTHLRKIPVLGLCFSSGAWTCLMLASLVYAIVLGDKREFVLYMFSLITLLVCIDSPVNNYFRYALPIAVMTPILSLLCFSPRRNDLELAEK